MGRPSKYSEKIANEICERIAKGETLRAICRDAHLPSDFAVRQWALDDVEGFSSRYLRARELGYDAIAEQAMQIADTPVEGVRIEKGKDGRKEVREDMLGHRKLQVETRLRLLAKWSPKKYGDKQQLEHSGSVGLESLVAGDHEKE